MYAVRLSSARRFYCENFRENENFFIYHYIMIDKKVFLRYNNNCVKMHSGLKRSLKKVGNFKDKRF